MVNMKELIEREDDFLTVDDVAMAMGVTPQNMRTQAQSDQSKLGFPVCVIGKRILIPRIPFLEWVGALRV